MHILPHDQKGGMENGVINIINNLDDNISQFSICYLSPDRSVIKKFLKKQISFHSIPKKEFGFDFSLCLRLARLFRKEKIDIVHTHNWGTYFHGVVGAKLAQIKCIIHGEHGFNFHELELESWQKGFLKKLLSTQVSKIVTMSNNLKEHLGHNLKINENKITTIYNGVDINLFSPVTNRIECKNKYGAVGKLVIGSVGRMDQIKNFPLLINAVKMLATTNPDLMCLFFGEGPELAQLKKLSAELGIAQFVKFAGFTSDVSSAMNAIDIFVLPSHMEGLSNTILEAMACEIPVVASNVGGNVELIEHRKTGLLFQSNNLRDLVEKISTLLSNDELRKKIVLDAKKKIVQDHSLVTMLNAYQSLYLTNCAHIAPVDK